MLAMISAEMTSFEMQLSAPYGSESSIAYSSETMQIPVKPVLVTPIRILRRRRSIAQMQIKIQVGLEIHCDWSIKDPIRLLEPTV